MAAKQNASGARAREVVMFSRAFDSNKPVVDILTDDIGHVHRPCRRASTFPCLHGFFLRWCHRVQRAGLPICFPRKCAKLCQGSNSHLKASARRNSGKKVRIDGTARKIRKSQIEKNPSNEHIVLSTSVTNVPNRYFARDDFDPDNGTKLNVENSAEKSSIASPTRRTVLWACTITSGLILSLGLIIRQVSHVALVQGWPIIDSSAEVSFDFRIWHLQLIVGLVISISLFRYCLLRIWPDFAESSEAANRQILSSLQPLDYLVVSFLPAISEELLFRGALLPLFGLNWRSALVIGALFGGLHLSGGRRYSFAIWASFVGFIYGLATIMSSSMIVPMASHSLNNLIGGILWRYNLPMPEKKTSI